MIFHFQDAYYFQIPSKTNIHIYCVLCDAQFEHIFLVINGRQTELIKL